VFIARETTSEWNHVILQTLLLQCIAIVEGSYLKVDLLITETPALFRL
jgi:hypothetical protein